MNVPHKRSMFVRERTRTQRPRASLVLWTTITFCSHLVFFARILTGGDTQLGLGIMSAEDSGPSDHPGHIPLDVENYPVAPSTLQLEQMYMFVRHGAFQRSFTYSLYHSIQANARP